MGLTGHTQGCNFSRALLFHPSFSAFKFQELRIFRRSDVVGVSYVTRCRDATTEFLPTRKKIKGFVIPMEIPKPLGFT